MGTLETRNVRLRFIPIVCSAPLIYAHQSGLFRKAGLEVELRPAPGWSGVKELMVHGKIDAAHMLAPMPLACARKIDGKPAEILLSAIQNTNGQALTLASKHRGLTSVKDMRGFRFAVPYRFSMHYYLLCHYLAANGVHPLEEVTIQEVSPPRMPYFLKRGWVDGILAPEPFNQIAVNQGTGFIHILSKDIWDGHPCCSFAIRREFAQKNPNTSRALLTAVLQAELQLHQAGPEKRRVIAREICGEEHLNQPDSSPVEQVLTGEFEDGNGRRLSVPKRVDFLPHPWADYGTWMLTQMQRWRQLSGPVDYHEVVGQVFQTRETIALAESLGFPREEGPSLAGIAPFTGADPQGYMESQPFCSYEKHPALERTYGLSGSTASRLLQIVEAMAEVAGGTQGVTLDITSSDEVGYLEQVFNEMTLNGRFATLALAEEKETLEAVTRALREQVSARKSAEAKVVKLNRELEAKVALQSQTILELSTPAIKFWDHAILVPMVGVIDTERAQMFMESLLVAIVKEEARVVILDLTGVPLVDTQVAHHLVKAVRAAAMLGARVTVCGVSPSMAQTLTQLGTRVKGARHVRDLQTAIRETIRELGAT
ncbi:MAG: ABC transporter substrate-binding protein [Pseudomonadota bacterium]